MSKPTLLPADQAQALSLLEAAQSSDAGIVSRTVLHTPEARVILFSFAAEQELTSHTSPRRALVQMLDGSCEFLFAGRWQTLKAGMFLHMPPGHPHAVRADHGPFSMLLTLCAETSSPSSP